VTRRAGRALAVVVALLTVVGVAGGQVPILYALSSQQNPWGERWYRLDTPHFTVIHPDSLAREAQRAAALLERAYEPLTRTLARRPERIPVVLNNRSMVSNAYVAWSPRRTQWYAMPNTTVDMAGPIEWYSLLAIHEGRHIVQERAVRTGIVGFLSRLFGDNTTAFFGGALYFPSWFWEGDAVGLETALTRDGRGRQPSFTQRTRALTLDGQRYPHRPAWQGSYKTYYPDWYELGYMLTTHVRRTYGDSAWRRAIVRAARNPLAPMALSMALRRETGRSLVELHNDAVRTLDTLWRAQLQQVRETPANVLPLSTADYREFTLPQFAGDGSIIALYSDLATVRRLVRIRNGRVEVLRRAVGLFGELQFHVSGSTVVWSEYEVSPRWGEESFLAIRALDLETGRVRRVTRRSRYYAPAISPDGRTIAAVQIDLARRTTLTLLDATTGEVRRALGNDAGFTLLTPTWTPDGSALLVVAIDGARGNALVRLPVDGGAADTLIGFTHDAISRPMVRGDQVYFGSPRSGLDNIYALHLTTRTLSQVTSRPRGAMWPSVSPSGDTLVFSDYSVRGYDVAVVPLDPSRFRAPERLAIDGATWAEPVVRQEGGASILDSLPTTTWISRPYTGWSRLFDFHSIAFAPTSDGINTGLVVESRNVLNTLGLLVGPVFNGNERTLALEGGVSYAGLPVIGDLAGRVGRRASTYTDEDGVLQFYSWREESVTGALRLPLQQLRGQMRRSLSLMTAASRTQVSEQPIAFNNEINNGSFTSLTYALSASQVHAAAYRDLYPRGATLTGVYRHTPGTSDYRSHQSSLLGALYLPGLARHHALVVDAALEEQRPDNYRHSSLVRFVRGYRSRFHESLAKGGVTYHAPLFYPDLALGNWLYLRRVQGNVFADAGRGTNRDGLQGVDYRSVGGEMTVDISPFGLRATLRTGVRVSQALAGAKGTRAEFVLQIP